MIGSIVNQRYRLDAEAGRGGMGLVYRAHDLLLDRDVAIKILTEGGLSTEGRAQLLREAQAAAKLNHPNIVAIHDAGETDGVPFIVMEFVEGGSLYERRPRDLGEIVSLARQVCAALEHAHAHGIIHRDLKPENVLIARAPLAGTSPSVNTGATAKLVDFGLARSVASRLTTAGTIAGTVFYLAPELALGQEFDGRADLYALGVMLYELAAGRLPFEADDPLSVISQHLYAPVVPPRARNPEIPAAFDDLIVQLLSKAPHDRPPSAAEVGRRLELREILDPKAAPARDLTLLERIERGRLVGRQRELQEARALWSRASAGQGHVLFVSGEPGIGKTRLVRELVTQVDVTGCLALVGESYAEGGLPYGPFAQVARRALHAGLAPDLPPYVLADLLALAPGLRQAYPDVPPNPPLDAQAEQQRLYENVVTFFAALSETTPVLLVLEDVHWADSGSLTLLRHLARRTRSQRLLIVATYREVELDQSRPFQEILADLNRERLATRLKLARLSREETRALLATLFAEEITSEFLEGIYHETEGNPFFVEEVCKALLESGQLSFRDGRWHRPSVTELGIPQSVRVAIQSRVSKLPETVQNLLRLAAVIGREFDFKTLAEASLAELPGGTSSRDPALDEETLVSALELAERAQLVEETGHKDGETLSFCHALIHTALLDDVSGLRRRRLHRQVLAAVEKQRPDDLEAQARHALESGELEKALDLSLRVAERARRVSAFNEALRLYDQAQEIAETLHARDQLARIREAIGDLQSRRDATASIRAYEEAFALVETPQERAALKSKIGATYAGVGDEQGLAYLKESVSELDPASQANELALALANIGRFHHYRGQHTIALDYLHQAYDIATPLDEPRTLTSIYGFLSGAYQHLARFDESIQWAREAIALGNRLLYPPAVALGYEFLAENSVMMGHWQDGLSFAAEDRRIGEETGILSNVSWAGYSTALAQYGLGDLPAAEQAARWTLELAELVGDTRLTLLATAQLALAQTDLGDEREAKETATSAVEQARQSDQVLLICLSLIALAHWHMQADDPGGALPPLQEAAQAMGPTESRSLRGLIGPRFAQAQLRLGLIQEAAASIQEALSVVREASSPQWEAQARHVYAQILAAQGQAAAADQEYGAAVAQLDELGSRLELGRTLAHWADLQAQQGKLDAARASLARALDVFTDSQAVVDAARVRQALDALPAGRRRLPAYQI